MLELIASIILIGSILGISIILFNKIPVLAALPPIESKDQEKFLLKIKKAIKQINPSGIFIFEKFLQKILLWIRILSSKIENSANNILKRLRQREKQKKSSSFTPVKKDNYWQEIKKHQNTKLKSNLLVKKSLKTRKLKIKTKTIKQKKPR